MNTVSEILFSQLGGNKFVAMTGSRVFATEKGLSILLKRNRSSANHLEIVYNKGFDLYTMKFTKVAKPTLKNGFEMKTKEIETLEGVCCDQLREIFEYVTGFATRL